MDEQHVMRATHMTWMEKPTYMVRHEAAQHSTSTVVSHPLT